MEGSLLYEGLRIRLNSSKFECSIGSKTLSTSTKTVLNEMETTIGIKFIATNYRTLIC